MKQAILFHGHGGSDKDYYWFKDTKKFLKSKGYKVWWPQLPYTDKPNLTETIAFLKANMPELADEDVIIGHSSACPLILYLLQTTETKVKQVVLVSGYYQPLEGHPQQTEMLPDASFDFDNIRGKAAEFMLINSDDDPWGCNYEQALPVAQALQAKLVLAPGQGHMGSSSFNQPYSEFPQLKAMLAV